MPDPSAHLNWNDGQSDEELLKASLNDPEAFSLLVIRYERKLYGLIWRLCSDPDAVDDLYQQVWAKAWGARLSFQGRSRFGTWLYAIALNQVREWRRKRRPQQDIESLPEPESRQPSALERLLGWDRKRQLDRLMSRLSDKDREILSLRYLQDLDYKEIATLQRRSLLQTRLGVFRALGRLRKMIQKDEL